MARASALQAEGQGFKSPNLHRRSGFRGCGGWGAIFDRKREGKRRFRAARAVRDADTHSGARVRGGRA